MSPRGFLARLLPLALLPGCVYYNAIYNAERLYDVAEGHRWAGRDSLAEAGYREVVEKAAKGFRQEPSGEWADDALYLLGRAHFRLGDLRAAQSALDRAAALAQGEQARLRALVYLGAARVATGDLDGGIVFLNEALRGLDGGDALAEGHLWRGRALLTAGNVDGGWWDLDRAGEGGRLGTAIAAGLERLRWGVRLGDRPRAEEGIRRLFRTPEAGQVGDTVAALARRSAEVWGWDGAAELLAGAEAARWDRVARGRIRLERARLLEAAGEAIAARQEARAVASGYGPAAAEARLLLARWHLEGARALVDLDEAVRFLLPVEDDPRAADLLEDVQAVAELAEEGLEEPLAWFAAAEAARDRLDAPLLARGLFLAYADGARDQPWSVKALLAALEVSPSEGDRAWLRGRLEGWEESPYVLAARGEPAPGFERLEEELARRLDEVRNR